MEEQPNFNERKPTTRLEKAIQPPENLGTISAPLTAQEKVGPHPVEDGRGCGRGQRLPQTFEQYHFLYACFGIYIVIHSITPSKPR